MNFIGRGFAAYIFNDKRRMIAIDIQKKLNLTIKEACEYSGIGEKTLRNYIRDHMDAPFIFFIGKKTLIKRHEFEEWNSAQFAIET